MHELTEKYEMEVSRLVQELDSSNAEITRMRDEACERAAELRATIDAVAVERDLAVTRVEAVEKESSEKVLSITEESRAALDEARMQCDHYVRMLEIKKVVMVFLVGNIYCSSGSF